MSIFIRFFRVFAAGNLVFSWLYSLIFVGTFFINQKGFPMLNSFLVFWGAVLLTKLLNRKKRYVWVILLCHALGCLVTSPLILASFYKPQGPLFDWRWLLSMWTVPRSPLESFLLVVILAGILLLWVCGVNFASKPVNYQNTIRRFEKGLLTFYFIALFAGVLKVEMAQLPLQVLNIFLWGIVAVGLYKNEQWGADSRTSHGFKLVTFFIIGLLLSIIPVLTFCMDYLRWAAERGLAMAQTAVEPVTPYLLSLLKLLFSRAGYKDAADASIFRNSMEQAGSDYSMVGSSASLDFITSLIWVLLAVLIIILAVLLVMVLIRVLLTKKGGDHQDTPLNNSLGGIWQRLLTLLHILVLQLSSLFTARPNRSPAEKAYVKLIRWGTFHGIEHGSSDTPYEYAARLAGKYEYLAGDIKTIIDCFCREIYGNQGLTPAEELSLQQAWKRIRANKPAPSNEPATA